MMLGIINKSQLTMNSTKLELLPVLFRSQLICFWNNSVASGCDYYIYRSQNLLSRK